jgi:hypothetical protein
MNWGFFYSHATRLGQGGRSDDRRSDDTTVAASGALVQQARHKEWLRQGGCFEDRTGWSRNLSFCRLSGGGDNDAAVRPIGDTVGGNGRWG